MIHSSHAGQRKSLKRNAAFIGVLKIMVLAEVLLKRRTSGPIAQQLSSFMTGSMTRNERILNPTSLGNPLDMNRNGSCQTTHSTCNENLDQVLCRNSAALHLDLRRYRFSCRHAESSDFDECCECAFDCNLTIARTRTHHLDYLYWHQSDSWQEVTNGPSTPIKCWQFGIKSSRLETGTVKKLGSGRNNRMQNGTLAIAVAFALASAFVYGIEFGRKITLDAVAIAHYECVTASYVPAGNYDQGESYDTYEPNGTYDYSCE